ncbi:tripartite tricarboxylate transporter substrate binding protein [Rhodoplanes sp. TEM]|uniref:Tripartite tricarboxylate transporter substrate binding protein n=1 Tax=Rhodoplanes tepidamans TaxID=200616 RepID=A0ABT5J4E5_RHOTP|nr:MULTISPECIES: tripartite tricarboxylate transporter substrate binding protein [Rhodoplanes]MDC7784496.1 tripartite tricarboxylate transporter substrate binding protein [Rhodoplanes tepidamans]MDC7983526.1 tripartite tricarboxylate transporter substrate binding protein [Rhodoplanes sp. TEM]MDQ0357004.1 tripartite-type tricarboxylate transporter receptor subunit TctC [Rhodoplanes tepidamans]
MHLLRALFGLALLLAPAAAAAQDFPSRPIRIVVPFPPGGPNDIIARTVGQRMSELLGQPVLIDNRGGAGGVLGTDAVAKAEPDGYTIGITSAGALAISSSLQEKIPYDPLKDFKPITLVAKVPEILAVAPNVKATTVAELVALAKAKPGDISFASSGPGSMPHLAGELFKIKAGIDIVHIPYRGAAPAVTDLLASQVHMVFLDVPVLLPHIRSGKLKAVAIGSRERLDSVKDVPTTAEAGYPEVEAENWYGMVAPAATPPAIVEKIHKATIEAMKSPDVKDKLAAQGAVLVGDTPDAFAAYIRSEIDKWRKVVEAAGVKPGN